MPTRRLTTRHWFSSDCSLDELLREHHNSDYLDAVMVEDADHLHELLERPRDEGYKTVRMPTRVWWTILSVITFLILFAPSVQTLLGHPIATGLLDHLLDLF